LATSQDTGYRHSSPTTNEKGKSVAIDHTPALHTLPARIFGKIEGTSIENGSLGLDWALVNTDNADIEIFDCNTFVAPTTDGGQILARLSGIVDSLPSRSPVYALTERGELPGMILGTAVSMRLPGASKMCEVWTVQLREPIGIVTVSSYPTLNKCIV
jgi:hypothetical protein